MRWAWRFPSDPNNPLHADRGIQPPYGIAPRLISTIFEKIVEINKSQGITILLVEQNANLALEISTYAYALETGRVAMEGESKKLRADPQLKATYLGG